MLLALLPFRLAMIGHIANLGFGARQTRAENLLLIFGEELQILLLVPDSRRCFLDGRLFKLLDRPLKLPEVEDEVADLEDEYIRFWTMLKSWITCRCLYSIITEELANSKY